MAKMKHKIDYLTLEHGYYKHELLYPKRIKNPIFEIVMRATTPVAFNIWKKYSHPLLKTAVTWRQINVDFEEYFEYEYKDSQMAITDLKRANLVSTMHVDGKWDLMEITFKSWSELFELTPDIIEKFL